MRSIFNYIIETDNRYNNKIGDLIVNTEITERDAIFVNRIGRIAALPIYTDGGGNLPLGSEVVVHHNVFRRMINIAGKETNSTSHLEEGKYLVYPDQIFAYKEGDSWKACDGFCFVAPLENEETWVNGSEKLLCGKMAFPDNNLVSQDVKEGDLVGFTPNSEYEFTIEGNKYYRILSNQINIIYGHKENATEASRGAREVVRAGNESDGEALGC